MNLILNRFGRIIKKYTTSNKNEDVISILASIKLDSDNPFNLYKKWYDEVPEDITHMPKSYCALANHSKNGKIQNRFIQLFKVDDKLEKFAFMTDGRTEKCSDFLSNPNVSLATLWKYNTDHNLQVIRQVRANGKIIKCSDEVCAKLFERLSLSAKMRWHICEQNRKIAKWSILQYAYENLLNEITTEITRKSSDILMPNHMTAYEIKIERMDFLHHVFGTKRKFIPDRIIFHKDDSARSKWKHIHVAC